MSIMDLFLIEPSGTTTSYIRFSSHLFATIQEQLNLSSNGLVLGVLEAAVFQYIKSETINCNSVTL